MCDVMMTVVASRAIRCDARPAQTTSEIFHTKFIPMPKTTHTLWMETAHAHTKHVCVCRPLFARPNATTGLTIQELSNPFQKRLRNANNAKHTCGHLHTCTHISSCETHALPDFVNYTNVSGPGTYACVCVLVAENYGKVSSTLFHVHSVCQPSVVLLACFVCVCV